MSQSQPEAEAYWTPEAIRSWRMWAHYPHSASISNQHIYSLTNLIKWDQDMPPSWCAKFPQFERFHPSPYWGCTCGWWALKPDILHDPIEWGERKVWHFAAALRMGVLGSVRQWGEVIEYEHGYRSQHVAIESIYQISAEPDYLESLPMYRYLPDMALSSFNRRARDVAENLELPIETVWLHG